MSFIKDAINKREELILKTGNSVKDRFVPYKVVIPNCIRVFYRESKGQVLELEKQEEQKKMNEYAARSKFGKPPAYGTVDNVFYRPGESGLLPHSN